MTRNYEVGTCFRIQSISAEPGCVQVMWRGAEYGPKVFRTKDSALYQYLFMIGKVSNQNLVSLRDAIAYAWPN